MKLVAVVVLWSALVTLVVLLGALWIVIRYNNNPECMSLGSACSFEDAALMQFALTVVPAIWIGGVILIALVWGVRRRRDRR